MAILSISCSAVWRPSHYAMLVLRDENKTSQLLEFIVVAEQLQFHFNSFELVPFAGLKLVRYERF